MKLLSSCIAFNFVAAAVAIPRPSADDAFPTPDYNEALEALKSRAYEYVASPENKTFDYVSSLNPPNLPLLNTLLGCHWWWAHWLGRCSSIS
jgi:hypothetical protein